MSERRYIRDTVADDFKHDWQKELDKREAWLRGVEDIRNTPKGTEVFLFGEYGHTYYHLDPVIDGERQSDIGGYGE